MEKWDGKERREDMDGRIDEIRQDIKDIKHILTGNGEPENGLVFKVAQNSNFVNFWQKFGWLVLGALAGIPPTLMAAVILNVIHLK